VRITFEIASFYPVILPFHVYDVRNVPKTKQNLGFFFSIELKIENLLKLRDLC
jgi:hypothetical protein